VRAQRFLNAIILFACSHSQNKHKLCSNDWFGSLSNGLSVTSATKESLRRLLERTKPFPFAILMASFGMIGLLPITLFAWAAQPAAPVELVLLVHSFNACLTGLIGLFVSKQVTLRWLASFGDVLSPSSSSRPKLSPKARFALWTGFWLILAALAVVLRMVAKSI
jgi:hypothetical protein